MSPRSGKRRRRGHPPMPIWIPVQRPCLRSMNVPGPYIMPVPEMYLPPWVLPPPYFAKPMCHCANDDFCTPNSCRNSADCFKSNPMYCPHGTKDQEADLQQGTIFEEEEENNPDVGICTSCRIASERRRMAVTHTRQANVIPHTNGLGSEHSDLEQYNQGSTRDYNTRRENTPVTSTEQGALLDENRSELVSPQLYNDCADLPCRTPFNSRELQTNSASRSGNLQKTGTQSNISTDQRTKSSSGYAADSELSDTKGQSNGVNKVSTCTGCSDLDNPDSAPANATKNKSFGHRSRKNEQLKTNKIHIDSLPDQLAEGRKHGSQSRCCMSPPESGTNSKMQNDNILGSRHDEERLKDSSRTRKTSECGCSSTKLTTNKQTKPISNMRMLNNKATNCECRFPPAFNHLGCSGNRGSAKCRCSNNNPLNYSK